MEALSLDDPVWATLEGGYRKPYDASVVLKRMSAGALGQENWSELWEELHHQYDVGSASYASVIALTRIMADHPRDWNFFGLVSRIEICRLSVDRNPPMPEALIKPYRDAWRSILRMAAHDIVQATDRETVLAIMAAVFAAKGDTLRAEAIDQDDEELEALLNGNYAG